MLRAAGARRRIRAITDRERGFRFPFPGSRAGPALHRLASRCAYPAGTARELQLPETAPSNAGRTSPGAPAAAITPVLGPRGSPARAPPGLPPLRARRVNNVPGTKLFATAARACPARSAPGTELFRNLREETGFPGASSFRKRADAGGVGAAAARP